MAEDISARLTPRSAVQFGRVVGGAFVVFALVAYWRDHPTTFRVLAVVGGILVVLSVVAPTVLAPVERVWMQMAHALSKITTPIVMGVLFFVVITPVGAIRRALGKNGLPRFRAGESAWTRREAGATRGDLNRQF